MEAVWVTAIIQGGAITILAYHFLLGLPQMLRQIAEDQRMERVFWASEAEKDRSRFHERSSEQVEALRELKATIKEEMGLHRAILNRLDKCEHE